MTTLCTIEGFEYTAPGSIKEALATLGKAKAGSVSLLAGGTDLLLRMKMGQVNPTLVVDIKNIPDLNSLEWNRKDGLRIGAAVSLSRLLALPQLQQKFSILAQACSLIGSIQIKNRGTMAGNICNAAPSADAAPALLSLGANAVIASAKAVRAVPLEEFFKGPGKTVITGKELLVEIQVPNQPANSAGCYLRHTTRMEMDIAVVGVGSFLVVTPAGKVKEARIALGAVAPIPMRAPKAEALVTGKSLTWDIIQAAAQKAAAECRPIDDIRASADYRRELVKVLTRRTLAAAAKELGLKI